MLTSRSFKFGKLSSLKLECYSKSLWSQTCRQKATSFELSPVVNARNLSTGTVSRRRWLSYVSVFTLGFVGSVAFTLVTQNKAASPIDPATFQAFTLESKERVSSTSSIFTLSPTSKFKEARIYDKAWQKGVWSVQIKQPQLQIARAYTPLPPASNDEEYRETGKLSFLIRQDPKGEVSGYLHRLPQDATIDLRGPQVEYRIPDDVKEVLFLAGGTGIAPALQIAHTLYYARAGRDVSPKMHILWANRRREDCEGGVNDTALKSSSRLNLWSNPFLSKRQITIKHAAIEEPNRSPMVLRLDSLKEPQSGLVSIEYFVDEEQTSISEAVIKGALQSSVATSEGSSNGRKLILVSGPDGFIEHFAGSKAWQNGKEVQGPLKGLLGQIDHSGWEVWKL
ncbi:mitochondrial peripheral inner membrane protein [Xylographa carneopallida]|nr:mitochondrial peripheral inner membrane protein [Xylographa carneopallida]